MEIREHKVHILPIGLEQLPVVAEHVGRTMRENDDEPHGPFAPFDPGAPFDVAGMCEAWAPRLAQPVTSPDFGRIWGLYDDDDTCRGHCDLRASGLATASHRVEFGVGLERGVRGQGWGRRLTETCLAFCRAQDTIRWVDLGVFAHNTAARSLYERLGFKAWGVMKERFVVGGRPVDDVSMTLFVGHTEGTLPPSAVSA